MIKEQQSFLRLLIGLAISFIFLVAMLAVEPYKRSEDNLLATMVTFPHSAHAHRALRR